VVDNLRERRRPGCLPGARPGSRGRGDRLAHRAGLATKASTSPRPSRHLQRDHKKAVTKALANPGEIDLCKVDVARRRVLDRLMGLLSPLLDKVKRGSRPGA
jgi:hypothetical protein